MVIGCNRVCTLWFLRPDFVRSLLSILCPLRSLCHALSSGVNNSATARGQLLPTPSLTGSHTWCPVPPWFRVVRGQPLLPHSMGREQRWGRLRATPGLGYSGSSLSSCLSLSLGNPLCREDFPRPTHGVGMTWFHAG